MPGYNEFCENCYYCDKDTMQCKRHAPKPKEVKQKNIEDDDKCFTEAFWPWVSEKDWCGEWREE